MKQLYTFFAFRVAALLALVTVAAVADERPCQEPNLQKPAVFEHKFLDVNLINCTIASDGEYADSRRTSAAGLEWPKGTGKTAVFTAGIWLVGIHAPTDSLRTANIDYSTEYQPGPLLETFNTTTKNDSLPVSRADEPRYRLYKVEANRPAGDSGRQVDPWYEWPGDLGAPYKDLNGNGSWDPGVDVPVFYGDQQIWSVVNDVNNTKHTSLGHTPPMGVEMQVLYYAFDQPGVLQNTMFMRWTIINKSDADYDSVYVSLWSDVDLGDNNDDLPACDTTLDMGYVFNGDNDDGTSRGYGSTPPAVGFAYLQGPIVPGLPTDSARVGDGWRKGFENLGLTSFVPWCCGQFASLIDPPDASPNYAPIAYAYTKGMMGTARVYLTRPDGSIITYYFSGDPVAGTGDLHENFPLGVWPPSDNKTLANSGPFTLAKGDSQEVVAALVISQGTDRLNSVTLLKQDVVTISSLHESGIVVNVADNDMPLPEGFSLSQNYPNPFNPSTTIEFALPHAGFATLKVYNVLGEEVAKLIAGDHDAGTFKATWDASGMPSGMYFYRLTAGNFVATKKLMLLK
ncbi:MAG: T9SS type A sorting domain-containing protein [Bacteroidota bacterium]